MPEDIFGVPAHPLIVHVVAVLLPLAAIAGILIAFIRPLARRYATLVAGSALIWLPAVKLAEDSGENLEKQVNASLSGPTANAESTLMREHTDLADSLFPWALVLAIGLIAFAVVRRQFEGSSGSPSGGMVAAHWTAVLLTVAGAVLSLYLVIRIGHLGAEAAWTRVTST